MIIAVLLYHRITKNSILFDVFLPFKPTKNTAVTLKILKKRSDWLPKEPIRPMIFMI